MRSRDREIRRRLLDWFAAQARRLPWRDTTDPYAIWLSEVMLQQTTVAAVLPRYERFLRRFPDVESLARAREESVLAEWSGLGYYGRARNLRRAARRIVREHGGAVPSDATTLAELPGFGPYTAAAVASLAYGARVPAAEANVTRVLARVFAIPGAAADPRVRRRVLEIVARLLPRSRPGDLIAALMDLGQLVCAPRRPRCPACPLEGSCDARRRGDPARFPRPAVRARPMTVHVAAAAIESGGRVLLRRRRASYLDGLWEFPSAEATSAARARRELAACLGTLGIRLQSGRPLARARHAVVRRRLAISVFSASAPTGSSFELDQAGYRWFTPAELEKGAVPTLTRRIARACRFLPEPVSDRLQQGRSSAIRKRRSDATFSSPPAPA